MPCLITSAHNRSCEYGLVKIKNLWLANAEEIASITDADTDGIYDTCTFVDPLTMGWYKMEFEKDSASLTEALQVTAGGRYFTSTLVFNIKGEGIEFYQLRYNLGLGKFVGLVELTNGEFRVIGFVGAQPLEAISGTQELAGLTGDDSALTITLESLGEPSVISDFAVVPAPVVP